MKVQTVQKTTNYSQSFGKNDIFIHPEIKEFLPKVHRRLIRMAETPNLQYAGSGNGRIRFSLQHNPQVMGYNHQLGLSKPGAIHIGPTNMIVVSKPIAKVQVVVEDKPKGFWGHISAFLGFAPSSRVKLPNTKEYGIQRAVDKGFGTLPVN